MSVVVIQKEKPEDSGLQIYNMIKRYILYEKAMCFHPTVPNIIKSMLDKKIANRNREQGEEKNTEGQQ